MPAINFIARHAPPVEAGTKRQTVRKERLTPIRPGDILHLYTCMRTRNCRKLKTATYTMTQEIQVTKHGTLKLDGQSIYRAGADKFARDDGLRDWAELRDFLEARYGLPFSGVVIHW
jgi:hypothetical protein